MEPTAQTLAPARGWWSSPWLIALLILASALPLVAPALPPLLDLPGHLARYRVQLGLADSPFLQRYYGFHWAPVGNLGADLLVQALAPRLGLEPTVKLIALVIPMLFAGGLLAIARVVHGRIPPSAALALPLAYGTPFLYGFLNYTLSVSLALLAFALWLRLDQLGKRGLRGWLFVPLTLILYFTHIYGWGVLGLLCFGAELIRAHDEQRRSRPSAALAAIIACLPLAGPVIILLGAVRNAGEEPFSDWLNFRIKFAWLVAPLRDRWKLFDVISGTIVFGALLFAKIDPRLRFSRPLLAGVALLSLACLLLPFWLLHSSLADMRLLPVILGVALVAIDLSPSASRRFAAVVALGALAFFAVRTAATAWSFDLAARQQAQRLTQLDHVPRGARLLTLVGSRCEDNWSSVRDTHLGSMVTVRRDGFSNDHWPGQGINLLEVKYQPPVFDRDPSEKVQPEACVVTRTLAQALRSLEPGWFDYLWLLDTDPIPADQQPRFQLITRQGNAALYRITR